MTLRRLYLIRSTGKRDFKHKGPQNHRDHTLIFREDGRRSPGISGVRSKKAYIFLC